MGGGVVEIKAGEDRNISFTADKVCDERCGLGKQKQWASWYEAPEKACSPVTQALDHCRPSHEGVWLCNTMRRAD